MNSHLPTDPAADEQASLWAARLEGGHLSAADRARLEAWLAESPRHRSQLSSYCQFSADLERPLPALAETGVFAEAGAAPSRRARWNFPKIVAAAAAMAALGMLGFWRAQSTREHFENFSAAPGHRQAITLADGTRVDLNARTNLQFTNGGRERRARLIEGEAFFAVSKNPARPFLIETQSGLVRVTGTSFVVHTEAAALDVTVLEGTVQVQPGPTDRARASTSFSLVAGDRLSANRDGVVTSRLSPEALDDALAWRQGIVVLVDEPLDAALARFTRYHARTVTVTPAAAKRLVSGRYSLDDLDGFLAFSGESLGTRSSQGTDGALRVSLRSE